MRLLSIQVLLPLTSLILAAQLQANPLQVYILAGQSNMQGHAKIRTFEHIGMDPATEPMLAEMLDPDGQPKVYERVWISSIGCAGDDIKEQTGKLTAGFGATTEEIGPEFTFGLYMQKFMDAPILLIKTSWGGKSLNADFRPPGAGPYEFNQSQLANFAKQGNDLATEGKLSPADEKAALEKMRQEGLTNLERKILEIGISNLELHYHGSAKILGGVGKSLAEAMAELKHLKK